MRERSEWIEGGGEGPRSKRRWAYQEGGEGPEQIGEERKEAVTGWSGGGSGAVFFSI